MLLSQIASHLFYFFTDISTIISDDIGRVFSALALFWTYCFNAFAYWILRFSKIWLQKNAFSFDFVLSLLTLLIQISN